MAMNFYEKELQKIVGSQHPDATYVGRACYVRLDEMNRAKIQFAVCGIVGRYSALSVTILNRHGGELDHIKLRFKDAWENVISESCMPYIPENGGTSEWHSHQPSPEDYQELSNALEKYLAVFQEQTTVQQWQQAML